MKTDDSINCSVRILTYRKILYILLALGVILVMFSLYYTLWNRVPSTIMVKAGVEQTLDFALPASGKLHREDAVETSGNVRKYESANGMEEVLIDFSSPVIVKANQVDTYTMKLKLFGVIPLKDVDVKVIQDVKLKPAGIPIGIYVRTSGVLVVAVGDFEGEDGQMCEPAKYVLQAGDYILEMNDEEITGKKQLIENISHSEGQEIVFKIRRDGEEFLVRAKPKANKSGEYKMGIWVRDNAQGVGTMTYIDENGGFGALGHGINDVDTGTLMELDTGTLYHTEIIGITRGRSGSPGELTGFIEYDDNNIMGSITKNTAKGIFGACCEETIAENEYEFMPIGLKHEIEIGDAQIFCSLGDVVKIYDVEVTDIHLENDNINRGIIIKITDPELLAVTGGIVQGMSGSPIVQNGRIVGAVTHVLVNDPTRGYGIFIENMLEH
ncbi:MAG: SpoIVB peptidase [Lachnospiraceae bacterium]|nr:SpoIVB peptidase [Lachnospiraceae bacterium]